VFGALDSVLLNLNIITSLSSTTHLCAQAKVAVMMHCILVCNKHVWFNYVYIVILGYYGLTMWILLVVSCMAWALLVLSR